MIREVLDLNDMDLICLLKGSMDFNARAVAMTQNIVIVTSLAEMIHPSEDFAKILAGAKLSGDTPVLMRLARKLIDQIEACDRALHGLVTPDLFKSRLQLIRGVL